MTKFKGLRFPSFLNPTVGTPEYNRPQKPRSLPMGKSWTAHDGRRRRLKNLRNACIEIHNSKDPILLEVLARVREVVKDEPEPEYGFLHIVFMAKQAADGAGVSVVDSINYMLQKWAERVDSDSIQPTELP